MYINVKNIMQLEVIVAAENIEDGARVTKLKGTKIFTVRRNIKIYGDKQQVIKCDSDFIFLVDDNGNIETVAANKELVVLIHPEDLLYDISNALEEDK